MKSNPQVTVCIPVAPYHKAVYQRAIKSVEDQTVPALVLHSFDNTARGAGAIRNYLLNNVTTPYVVFLDADDWIAPDFIESCLRVIRPGRYVYTDWWQGGKHIHASSKPWCGGTWHVITTLLNTDDARAVGGFDESLTALEDTDFYLKLTTNRICGIHVERPLFYYTVDGQRAINAHSNGLAETLKKSLMEKYGGKMGCCGNEDQNGEQALGERQQGDVLAMALWQGNRQEYGRATRRKYPYMSYPRTTWVNPGDITARPDHWRAVSVPLEEQPRYEGPEGLGQVMRQAGALGRQPAPNIAPRPAANVNAQPNYAPAVNEIVEVAKKRL